MARLERLDRHEPHPHGVRLGSGVFLGPRDCRRPHNFKDSGASVLVGLYDLNSEFYRSQAAGLFLNSAFGIGTEFAQAGVEGPSIFPRTAAGLRLAFKPTPVTVVRFALLDGVPLVRPDGSRALFQ